MDPRFKNLNINTLLTAVADFVMPRPCLACGRRLLPSERGLCSVCLADLPLTRFAPMDHNPMADRFNARIQERLDALENPPAEQYAYAAALFYYSPESPYSAITRHLKYERGLRSGRLFASMLATELAASPLYADVDTVVPVPLHRSRSRKRGYNQAEVIAREIVRALPGARLEKRMLERVRKTKAQAGVAIPQKAENVRGAFRAERLPSQPRHLLLVDDVFTTGSTLAACQEALREVLPPQVRISVATLGFVDAH